MSDFTTQELKKDNIGIRANRLDLQVEKDLHHNVTKQQTLVRGDVTSNVNDKSRYTIQRQENQNFGNRSAVYQDECNITTYGNVTRSGTSETRDIQGNYLSTKKGNYQCFSVVNFSAVVGSSTNFSVVKSDLGLLNTSVNLLSDIENSSLMLRLFYFSYVKLVKSTCESVYYKSNVTNEYITTGTVNTLNIFIGKRDMARATTASERHLLEKLLRTVSKVLQY